MADATPAIDNDTSFGVAAKASRLCLQLQHGWQGQSGGRNGGPQHITPRVFNLKNAIYSGNKILLPIRLF